MCERTDARRAQDAAADALTAACLDCLDHVGRGLKTAYNEVLSEGVPDELRKVMERLK